jgi:hypothetical protein
MSATSNKTIILAIIIIAIVVAAVAWAMVRQQRTQRLKRRFGPEYGLAVARHRSRYKGEAELQAREQRVSQFTIVPLTPADATRFSEAWSALQIRFVDNPRGVVAQADQLVRELMAKRGYPMGDFERRAADISVDYPALVSNYRSAQLIASRDASGEADTEELRQAVVHYRTLFDELLGVNTVKTTNVPPVRAVPAHS